MDLGRATCNFYPFIPRFFQKAYLTLTSHQCSPGWGPGIDAICGLSLLLVFSLAPRGFFPGTLVFPSPLKPRARSIQPKFRPVRPGKENHLKRWTCFFETFPVGPNRSIECWTEISGNFGWMDRAPRLSNSNSIWNARTRFNEFLTTPRCSVEAGDFYYQKDQPSCVIHWKEI